MKCLLQEDDNTKSSLLRSCFEIWRRRSIKIKILGSECQANGTCAKRVKQATTTKKDNAAACLYCLNYLVFLRSAADRAVSMLLWVVSRGRSRGFLWAGSIIQKNERNDNPTRAYSPVSDRRRLTALVEVHWARRVQAPMPQISGPNWQENHIIETCTEEGCAVSTQETAARRKWKIWHVYRLLGPIAMRKKTTRYPFILYNNSPLYR
jgi:hypothetical protein